MYRRRGVVSDAPQFYREKIMEMNEFRRFRRKGRAEMRFYVKGEDLSRISVSNADNPEEDLGMIARNTKNHADLWYVARQYFLDNFEEY